MPERPFGSGVRRDRRLHSGRPNDSPATRTSIFPPESPKSTTSVTHNPARKRKRGYGQNGSDEAGFKNTAGSISSGPAPNGGVSHRTKGANRAIRISDVSLSKSSSLGESRPAPDLKTQRGREPSAQVGHSGPQHQGQLAAKARDLLPIRKALPIWNHRTEIQRHLRERDVLLLVGETGSGKSTQVPQFLVNESWCRPHKARIRIKGNAEDVSVGGCIAITEPRRVAAISLARRVATEMGTPLGSASTASQVGYSVRFDNSTSPSTRIKFLTEGMLLQEMLRDPWLRQYSAVIVDEVHERGVNVDLIAGFVRIIVAGDKEGRGGVPLKVVIMSATADVNRLKDFYEAGFTLQAAAIDENVKEGSSISQETGKMEDEDGYGSPWSGISSEHGDAPVDIRLDRAPNSSAEPSHSVGHVATCRIEGRQHPVTAIYTPEPVQDFVDAALRMIFQIHYGEPTPGDILVFLTGQDDIEALEKLIEEYAAGMGPEVPKVLILPLFAALPQHAQQRVFQPSPHPNMRKIILATNIAETSVTVSGVRFVVDCGKAKIKQFRTRLGLDSLLVKPISKSSATQRRGRAGRETPGKCYHLYTEAEYRKLEPSSIPEILRCDVTHAVLTMKARGVDDIMSFPFLDSPPRESLEKALLQLFSLGALTESGTISNLGQQMAKLPLTPALARVLLKASAPEMDCLLEVIDIISCLSVENVFLNIVNEDKKEEADVARRELLRRDGDHLTLLNTVQKYSSENTDRRKWADQHFVSHRAMQAVMDVRKQLRVQCHRQKLIPPPSELATAPTTSPERAAIILKCFLTAFATNTARLCPDGSYKTVIGNQTVSIHPASGLFGRKLEAIMYHEYVFTNRSYARGVSAVQMDWIEEALVR
ncbi:MAG: putative ATP-dependent RNA helicase dhr2 [Trichoglossum hirsutum]|nr:MAG: putative ATP-dependent RNA helicase dhr2 [Trichoglossum hirsutum]